MPLRYEVGLFTMFTDFIVQAALNVDPFTICKKDVWSELCYISYVLYPTIQSIYIGSSQIDWWFNTSNSFTVSSYMYLPSSPLISPDMTEGARAQYIFTAFKIYQLPKLFFLKFNSNHATKSSFSRVFRKFCVMRKSESADLITCIFKHTVLQSSTAMLRTVIH